MAPSSSSSFQSHILLFFLILSALLCYGAQSKAATPLIFPIKKDDTNGVYYSPIKLGTPPYSINLLLDIASQWSWFDCDKLGFNSKSYRPVPCDSTTCGASGGIGCVSNDTCSIFAYNPYENVQFAVGLGQDRLLARSTDGLKYTPGRRINVPDFPVSCVGSPQGLPNTTQGIIALSRSTTSLPTTIFSSMPSKKLALCLPSSSKLGHGDMYIGGGPYYRPFSKQDFSKTLLVTKLLINPNSTAPIYSEGDASFEYFIDVRAIKVGYGLVSSFNNTLLDFDKDGVGGTKISTLTPYTTLHSSIFKPLVRAFNKAASDKKISKAAAVAPFGTCFKTKTIGNSKAAAGLDVPIITLVLRSDVHWEIHGGNSMVRVSKDVVCLGFVDGGKEPRTSIVIGGHQMEENLIEINVGDSTFGFTNSLLLHNTSCSHF